MIITGSPDPDTDDLADYQAYLYASTTAAALQLPTRKPDTGARGVRGDPCGDPPVEGGEQDG
jgi:hypothetical protein